MRFLTQKSNQVIDITTTVTGRLMFALCCICLPGFLAIPGMAQAQAFEWPQVDPELAGIEQSAIASLDAATRRGDYGNVTSLLVLRHGKLVYEGYFNGHGRDDLMPLYSVTKSWASALIGIAVMRGDIEGVNQPLQDILTQYSAASGYSHPVFRRLPGPTRQAIHPDSGPADHAPRARLGRMVDLVYRPR
jgi:CubicO group peptidase (beta-lactamase class C family)